MLLLKFNFKKAYGIIDGMHYFILQNSPLPPKIYNCPQCIAPQCSLYACDEQTWSWVNRPWSALWEWIKSTKPEYKPLLMVYVNVNLWDDWLITGVTCSFLNTSITWWKWWKLERLHIYFYSFVHLKNFLSNTAYSSMRWSVHKMKKAKEEFMTTP